MVLWALNVEDMHGCGTGTGGNGVDGGVGWGKKDLLDVTASNVTRVLLRLSAFAAA